MPNIGSSTNHPTELALDQHARAAAEGTIVAIVPVARLVDQLVAEYGCGLDAEQHGVTQPERLHVERPQGGSRTEEVSEEGHGIELQAQRP
ncbi:MAG: hypothetical protein GEV05_04635 [Betaproteobacteria bacterium]|nr:hypothetical protein [Betaproteobacteria bacterium]